MSDKLKLTDSLIGTPVLVKKLVHMVYDENKNRIPYQYDAKPIPYYFIGVFYSPLGVYQKASGVDNYFGDIDYTPATLNQKGVIKLARLVSSIRSKPVNTLYSLIESQLIAAARDKGQLCQTS